MERNHQKPCPGSNLDVLFGDSLQGVVEGGVDHFTHELLGWRNKDLQGLPLVRVENVGVREGLLGLNHSSEHVLFKDQRIRIYLAHGCTCTTYVQVVGVVYF